MSNANSFKAPAYRVQLPSGRLLFNTENLSAAIECAKQGRNRLVYKHNRPYGYCEGNYSFYGQFGSQFADQKIVNWV
jgi:hypothetical protein